MEGFQFWNSCYDENCNDSENFTLMTTDKTRFQTRKMKKNPKRDLVSFNFPYSIIKCRFWFAHKVAIMILFILSKNLWKIDNFMQVFKFDGILRKFSQKYQNN